MIKINNGLVMVINENCSVGFEALYQSNIGQVTIYLDSPIDNNSLRLLQAKIWKYIGDNLLSESYKTVKIFS